MAEQHDPREGSRHEAHPERQQGDGDENRTRLGPDECHQVRVRVGQDQGDSRDRKRREERATEDGHGAGIGEDCYVVAETDTGIAEASPDDNDKRVGERARARMPAGSRRSPVRLRSTARLGAVRDGAEAGSRLGAMVIPRWSRRSTSRWPRPCSCPTSPCLSGRPCRHPVRGAGTGASHRRRWASHPS